MKKILVIDNYDSFVYNLVHYLEALDVKVDIMRNDYVDLKSIALYDKLLLSPGPGVPFQAGQLMEVIEKYYTKKPILGVCLGQQAIASFFGCKLINLKQVYHGVETPIKIVVKDEILYKNIPSTLSVGRYHSWVVHDSLPNYLETTAVDANGNIMSLRHKHLDVKGVQFHPESVLTPHGRQIIKNWVYN